jgi:hypothetical protein
MSYFAPQNEIEELYTGAGDCGDKRMPSQGPKAKIYHGGTGTRRTAKKKKKPNPAASDVPVNFVQYCR